MSQEKLFVITESAGRAVLNHLADIEMPTKSHKQCINIMATLKELSPEFIKKEANGENYKGKDEVEKPSTVSDSKKSDS